ncbi:hypothetical protein SDC9_164857 [bioreactor metagenome]|uniref:Uncharacterized protein n=1 Tax=bioreactor metagenome TaxID=1076179 RepID=A0A645G011_9ZZZZ
MEGKAIAGDGDDCVCELRKLEGAHHVFARALVLVFIVQRNGGAEAVDILEIDIRKIIGDGLTLCACGNFGHFDGHVCALVGVFRLFHLAGGELLGIFSAE